MKFSSQKRQQTILSHEEVKISVKNKKANNDNVALPKDKVFLISKVMRKIMKKKTKKNENKDENNNDDGDDSSKRSSRKKTRNLKKERTSGKSRIGMKGDDSKL